MSERSSKARRVLHGLRAYVAQLSWEQDKAEGKRLLSELERLIDRVALRPGNTREPEEYTRRDKIRDELANDPHCYD